MFRSLVRPAVVGRPGKIVGLPWDWSSACSSAGVVAGGCSLRPRHRRSAKASPFMLRGDGALLINYIKAGQDGRFREVMAKVKEALAKSEKPERKAQADGWKIFKADLNRVRAAP